MLCIFATQVAVLTGKRRWYVVGCYIPPTCTTTIEQVQKAIDHRPTGVELIVMGDLTWRSCNRSCCTDPSLGF